VLEEAANEIENSQDEDFEFLPDGSMRVHVKGEEDSKQGHAMVQSKAEPASAPAADKKEGEKNATKSANQYANWWEEVTTKAPKKDDTPEWIRDHPDYKKLVDRFLPEFFADANLNTHLARKPIIDHDDIKETKEREGVYPNELDQEMQGYTYGDKLRPQWFPYVTSNNYWNYWAHQGTFAPPFNPAGLYESPYYDYGDRVGWGNWTSNSHGFWGVDTWQNFLSQKDSHAEEFAKHFENKDKFVQFMQTHPPPGFNPAQMMA
jgi:hypothetical protein